MLWIDSSLVHRIIVFESDDCARKNDKINKKNVKKIQNSFNCFYCKIIITIITGAPSGKQRLQRLEWNSVGLPRRFHRGYC